MDAEDFLAALRRYDDGDGVTEIRVKEDTGGMVDRKFSRNPSVIADLVKRTTAKRSSRLAVYYGVCPRYPDSRKGTKDDVASIPALWADVDTHKMGWDTRKTIDFLYGLPYPLCPTMCVYTGGGLHLYWHLDVAITLADVDDTVRKEQIAAFETVNKVVQRVMSSDMVWDVSRVLRLPGTWNTKARTDDDGAITDAVGGAQKVTVLWDHSWAPAKLIEYARAFDDAGEHDADGRPTRVLTPAGWGSPEDVQKFRGSDGVLRDEAEAIRIAHRQETRNQGASWEHIWSRARYRANRWPYYGIDEATMRATAHLWCKGGVTEAEVVALVLRKLKLIHADQCPGEDWDWDKEEAKVARQLSRWVVKWDELKVMLEAAKKAERKRRREEEKANVG